MALDIFRIPPTEADNERLYSMAGDMVSDDQFVAILNGGDQKGGKVGGVIPPPGGQNTMVPAQPVDGGCRGTAR